ncbi:ABC transporter G family member 23 [Eumeta japonica]|uniref:ABC transporter G family member 23 n=1 Tax=Eumeta variegata TaxID=151549 RepID=A0A4C1YLG7_EUMVA|nr:ABC transporter G family member 23 [Eumeta japonica]
MKFYGLLGASGCGKTTLLSCIVGRRKLNSGEIWVLGGKPGTKGSGVPGKRVGYMPQEIALYGEFTIRETMMYFGWIFGMGTSEIVERLRFLLDFLDLPSENRMVKNLSIQKPGTEKSPDENPVGVMVAQRLRLG